VERNEVSFAFFLKTELIEYDVKKWIEEKERREERGERREEGAIEHEGNLVTYYGNYILIQLIQSLDG